MKDVVVVPVFNMKEDDAVVKQFEQLFAGSKIATVDCNDIANEGGILNCIAWNAKVL